MEIVGANGRRVIVDRTVDCRCSDAAPEGAGDTAVIPTEGARVARPTPIWGVASHRLRYGCRRCSNKIR